MGYTQDDLKAMEKQAQATFWGHLGCEIVSLTDEEAIVRIAIKPHHLNMMGIVHGGVTSSLIDNAMGLITNAARPDTPMVTSNLNLHFVAPLTGEVLEARAHIIHETTRSLTCYATVTDEFGQVGSIGTGTFRAKRK
ncbi:PaaI family thioesterase [Paenibacillus sp. ACRRX]|uniref:PaaI family thioesterase n=1 Tax=Paenibacillus sp. ACRRX TaxID=2918206 RepID=UPI001EF5D628|nr:PaaI family thioesterase [Paenibacillus sp. ACRRX]MCG7407400.1 PaaI family thioesterase [Paenibacillus sp. ACRRX]